MQDAHRASRCTQCEPARLLVSSDSTAAAAVITAVAGVVSALLLCLWCALTVVLCTALDSCCSTGTSLHKADERIHTQQHASEG
jgi:hypothetical protein